MVTELYDTNLAGLHGRRINTVVLTIPLENGRCGLQDAKAVQMRDRRMTDAGVREDFIVGCLELAYVEVIASSYKTWVVTTHGTTRFKY